MRLTSTMLLMALAATGARAEGDKDWQARALKAQSQLDRNVPIAQALWLGTHNSYNSGAHGYADWNQSLSIKDQLRQGAREVVFDVHWYNSELRLCHGNSNHGGCAPEDRRFKAGLDDIKDWLKNNPDEVVILKIEGQFGDHHNRFHREVKNNLGLDRIYKPTDQDPGVSTCAYLNQDISKAAIRAKGRSIVLVVENNNPLCKEADFYKIAFRGLNHTSSTNTEREKFVKVSGVDACRSLPDDVRRNEIVRVFDPRTKHKIGSDGGGIKLDGSKIDDFLSCGLNIFEMFNYKGDGSDMKKRFIWSWDSVGQEPKLNPSAQERCAVLQTETNRFRVTGCGKEKQFACVKPATHEWCVATDQATFDKGDNKCAKACGAGFKFGAPWSRFELNKLVRARNDANVTENIYINLTRPGDTWVRLPAISN